MPRGQRKSIDEQIAELDKLIETFENKAQETKAKLSELSKQKKTLVKQKAEDDLLILKNVVESTGLSIEEAVEKLQK